MAEVVQTVNEDAAEAGATGWSKNTVEGGTSIGIVRIGIEGGAAKKTIVFDVKIFYSGGELEKSGVTGIFKVIVTFDVDLRVVLTGMSAVVGVAAAEISDAGTDLLIVGEFMSGDEVAVKIRF